MKIKRSRDLYIQYVFLDSPPFSIGLNMCAHVLEHRNKCYRISDTLVQATDDRAACAGLNKHVSLQLHVC